MLVGDIPGVRGTAELVLPAAMLPLRKLRGAPPKLMRRKGVVGAVLALEGDPMSSSSMAHSSMDSELELELVEVLALRW